jgi:hypothetical protein
MNVNMNVGGTGGIDRRAEFGEVRRGEQSGESFGAHLEKIRGKTEETAKEPVKSRAPIDINSELNALGLLNLDRKTRLMAAINIREKGMPSDEAVLDASEKREFGV